MADHGAGEGVANPGIRRVEVPREGGSAAGISGPNLQVLTQQILDGGQLISAEQWAQVAALHLANRRELQRGQQPGRPFSAVEEIQYLTFGQRPQVRARQLLQGRDHVVERGERVVPRTPRANGHAITKARLRTPVQTGQPARPDHPFDRCREKCVAGRIFLRPAFESNRPRNSYRQKSKHQVSGGKTAASDGGARGCPERHPDHVRARLAPRRVPATRPVGPTTPAPTGLVAAAQRFLSHLQGLRLTLER